MPSRSSVQHERHDAGALTRGADKTQARNVAQARDRLLKSASSARTSVRRCETDCAPSTCSRHLCPGWSHHTPQASRSQPGTSAPAPLIPVPNLLERRFVEERRRLKIIPNGFARSRCSNSCSARSSAPPTAGDSSSTRNGAARSPKRCWRLDLKGTPTTAAFEGPEGWAPLKSAS